MSALSQYLEDTQRPIYSAVLVFPFLVTYHVGLLILRPDVINGGHAIIQHMLRPFPISASLASTLFLLIAFGIWQFSTKAKLEVNPEKLALMFAECIVYAVVLFWFMSWFAMMLSSHGVQGAVLMQAVEENGSLKTKFLSLTLYCGAGVYEEFVFRVLLLGLLMLMFTKLIKMEAWVAAAWSVVLGSLIFSIFHYGPGGDAFNLNSFLQRAFAGVYFSTLFVTRSFGVAAVAHALYDIRVGFSA